MLFGVEIAPVRLLIAGVCTAAALALMLFLLIRWIVRKVRYQRRYGKGFRPNSYTAQRKKHQASRPRYGAQTSVTARHSRPTNARRRYGRGYQPEQERKRNKKTDREHKSVGGKRLR